MDSAPTQRPPPLPSGADGPVSALDAPRPANGGGARDALSVAQNYAPAPGPMPARATFPLGLSRADARRLAALTLAGAAALAFLWQVQDILPPFLIALFLAALLDPTLRRWERLGRSRTRSTLTLYFLGLLALTALVVLIGPPVRAQIEDLTANSNRYITDLQGNADRFLRQNTGLLKRFNVPEGNVSALLEAQSGPIRTRVTALLGGLTLFATALLSKALWVIIIPIAGFFLMRDFPLIRARAIALFPEHLHDDIDRVSLQVVEVFGDYLKGLARICTLYAVVSCLLYALLGLKYALFLGLLAGLFYAMPVVGQLFTATIVGAVAYLSTGHKALWLISVPEHSASYTLLAVGGVIIANNVFDQLIYPRVVGGSVGLHPVVSIFALMAGATLFGIAGMLLAVPVAASVQVVLMACFPRLTLPPPAHLTEPLPRPASEANSPG